MAADFTVFNDMLKEYYTSKSPELLASYDHPLYNLVPKTTDWGGESGKYIVPLHVERPQAVGADFATVLSNKGMAGVYDRFEMGRKKKYGFAQLDRLTMLASMKSPKAFLKLYTAEVNGTLSQIGADIAWNLYRDATGKRGTVGSISTTTITLDKRTDVVGFSVGMKCVFTDGGSAAGAAQAGTSTLTGDYEITAINRSTGVLTFDTDLAALGVAATDHIHRDGDIVSYGTYLGIEGLSAHIPETAPSSGTFQGVDWTVDTDRLAGLRLAAASSTIEDALVDGGMRLKEAGKKVTHAFMNPYDGGRLIKELGAKVQHDKVKSPGKASVSFDAIKVYTPAGTVPVVFDADCPRDTIWMLNLNTWKLVSTNAAPHIFDNDVRMLRESNSDAYEVRCGAYLNLACNDPGSNLRIDLD